MRAARMTKELICKALSFLLKGLSPPPFALFWNVAKVAVMTRAQLPTARIGKRKARRPLMRMRRAEFRHAGVMKESAAVPDNDDEPLPLKSIGEIAAALVARLAAQKRDA